MKTFSTLFASLLLISLSLIQPVVAEQKKTLGNWDIHYIAFNSTFLTPDVARAANLSRNKTNAIINISVLDKSTFTFGMFKPNIEIISFVLPMIKDLYNLGLVLERKYRLLRITYNIFMVGIIVSVLMFIIAFKNSGI